ncbi:putative F-box associated interaction domain-containing protein [Helianthus annuus]|nr:putative F-box associated interaction domain-containing protein [Helianthus annuus]
MVSYNNVNFDTLYHLFITFIFIIKHVIDNALKTEQLVYKSSTYITCLKIWVKRVGLTRINMGRVRVEIFDPNNNMGRVRVEHFNPPTRNPSTRQPINPTRLPPLDKMFNTQFGFGVCRETSDPKIVKIRYVNKFADMESVNDIPWQVEIFTLSTGVWRSPYGNLPRKSIVFDCRQNGVCVDGFCYWLATDRSTVDVVKAYNMIVSFDMTHEEFREVNLPPSGEV